MRKTLTESLLISPARLGNLLSLTTTLMNLELFNNLTSAATDWGKERFYYTTDSTSFSLRFPYGSSTRLWPVLLFYGCQNRGLSVNRSGVKEGNSRVLLLNEHANLGTPLDDTFGPLRL